MVDISKPALPSLQALKNKAPQRSTAILIVIIFLFISGLLYSILFSKKITPSSNSTVQPTSTPTATPTPTPVVSIGLVGDLGLGRHITSTARHKNNFNWSFEKISSWLQFHDFNVANLESPIIANCPEGKTGTFTFCGDERFLPYLQENKFVFNLANNHIFNYGTEGYLQTKEFLTDFNLTYFPDFATKEVNGIRFGFLGYDFISNPKLDPQILLDDVQKYDSQVDWLIVSIHWGNEYLPAAETWRVNLAQQLIDAGADIIHGHHPHVWQDYEIYRDKPLFYSFGNFVFDQSWSYETSHSQIARLQLSKDKLESLELFPIEINFNSQPALMP